jgi:hypothetical protein
MRPAEVRCICKLDDTGRTLMRSTVTQPQLSARGFHQAFCMLVDQPG